MSIRGHRIFPDGNPLEGCTGSLLLLWPITSREFALVDEMKLCGEAVEIAFDYEDGDIIAKAYVFRKIRRATEDVVHEPFRG
jgi:hypothetical protein